MMLNPEKVGKFIKDIRKKNNLTQKQLADKYGVTYQAVSKWENGINLPEVTLIRQMSKDFNISVEDILDGELLTKKKNRNKLILIIGVFSLIIIALILIIVTSNKNNRESFEFKTISSTCKDFNVSGSLAYDNEKSSIYISHINYCGGNDETTYKEIECNLYEKNGDITKKISSCKSKDSDMKLEDYLKGVELNIDKYTKTCKNYTNENLYLEVNATDKNNKIITYKIPLNINENCPK